MYCAELHVKQITSPSRNI